MRAKYPQTKHGGDRKSTEIKGKLFPLDTPSFATDTANKIHKTPHTVRMDVQIASRIPEEVRDIIRETPLADKKTELLTLSRFDKTTRTGRRNGRRK